MAVLENPALLSETNWSHRPTINEKKKEKKEERKNSLSGLHHF